MKQKLIGVTARILYEKEVRKQFVNERYLKALQNQGLNTIMLTLENCDNDNILALCDGFVIAGGPDVDPKFFNEENKGESKKIDEHLDDLDKAVVLYAIKHKLPLLGICRGHQSINIFMGGSLHQDIGHSHENTKHNVTSTKNRLLDFPDIFETNSYHHQSIKKTADGFDVIAVADDQTIEAIVHKTLPIIGIQWHPEMMQQDSISQMIFAKFKALVMTNA